MSVQSGDFRPVPDFIEDGPDRNLPGGAYRANLYVFDPGGRISWYALTPRSFEGGRYFTLGRAAGCDIVLADASVSARHACIVSAGDELVLRDLGSTNGTLLNDEPVKEAALRHGDVLRFGATDVRFLLSDRRSTHQVVLQFTGGPNAGRTVPTYGASVTVGRLDCGVNLPGPGVAPQHVRIDAYGRDVLFVATLRAANETWLNDQQIRGVAPARAGDRLRIGPHEMALQVSDDSEQIRGIPRGAGTLLVGEAGGVRGADPVAQLSSDQFRALQYRLADSLPVPADDTMADGRSASEILIAPTDPPELSRRGDSAAYPQNRPSARYKVALRRRRRWLKMLLVPLLLGGAAVTAAALIPVPRTLYLPGALTPADEQPIASPTRGRLEKLYFRPGDKVVPGDPVAWILDLEAQAELDRLALESQALEQRLGTTHLVPGEVPASLLRQVDDARTALGNASQVERLRDQEFNQRRGNLEALEAARRTAQDARLHLAALEREVEAAGSRRRIVTSAPEAGLVEKIEALLRRRTALEAKLRVQVTAPAGGVVLRAGEQPVREGQSVTKGEPLFRVADVSRLRLSARVPGQWLGTVEARGRAVLLPEGYPDRRLEVTLGEPARAAEPDGSFLVEAEVANQTGALRPGQPVQLAVELPRTNALEWVWRKAFDTAP